MKNQIIFIILVFICTTSFVRAEDLPSVFEKIQVQQDFTQIKNNVNSENLVTLINTDTKTFKDLPNNHQYFEEINQLVTDGVFEGYADGSFKPDQPLNRVEALKLIFEIANLDFTIGISAAKFNDIEESTWYNKYLNQAYYLEIINGYPDGSFKPATEVNLVEFLKMLFIAQKVDLSKVNMMQIAYADTEPNTWYTKYINFAKQNDLVDQDFANRVYPDQPLTRGRAAFILYQFKNWKNTQTNTEQNNVNNNSNDNKYLDINEGQAIFVSQNYHFAIQYPKLWFYSNVDSNNSEVIRSYAFGPDDLSTNPPLVVLNLLPFDNNFTANANTSKTAYSRDIVDENLISLATNIGKPSRVYQIVGPKEQENTMLQMLESITTDIDGLESYNPSEKNSSNIDNNKE